MLININSLKTASMLDEQLFVDLFEKKNIPLAFIVKYYTNIKEGTHLFKNKCFP